MKSAAEQRYWDSLALALTGAGSETGALYLTGYAAEMLMKCAYFQIIGVPVTQDIAPHLQGARTHAFWRGGNLHTLKSWYWLLNDIRSVKGIPWPPASAATIERYVLMVDTHWRESLRYTALPATEAELNQAFMGADWLLTNYDLLWR